MAIPMKKFTLGERQFAKGWYDNFTLAGGGLAPINGDATHTFICRRLDSAENDGEWGRIIVDGTFPEESQVQIFAFASDITEFDVGGHKFRSYDDYFHDPKISASRKKAVFRKMNAAFVSDASDMLLYSQKGRYLWVLVNVVGESEGILKSIRVIATKQTFMESFPEIYRNNEFFERYLSVFSSLFMDLQNKIESLDSIIDIDSAPSDMLPVFAEWLGLKIEGGFLGDNELRKLIKNAYSLNRKKGTRGAIEEVARIFLGCSVIIVEQSDLKGMPATLDPSAYERLFGASPMDFTILVDCEPNEILHSQFVFLINQFKPVRSRVNVVFLSKKMWMDAHCYLDINASIVKSGSMVLNSGKTLGGNIKMG